MYSYLTTQNIWSTRKETQENHKKHFFVTSSHRLKPFTSYQFRVKATNDIGDSEYSEESEAVTTLQDGKWQEISFPVINIGN